MAELIGMSVPQVLETHTERQLNAYKSWLLLQGRIKLVRTMTKEQEMELGMLGSKVKWVGALMGPNEAGRILGEERKKMEEKKSAS